MSLLFASAHEKSCIDKSIKTLDGLNAFRLAAPLEQHPVEAEFSVLAFGSFE
jgi:hypothetical protein